jgi:hypothetical protein
MQGSDTVPLWTVVKFQALIRGFLTRRRVARVYGFASTPGISRMRKT